MNHLRIFFTAIVATHLTGCLPLYQGEAGKPTARLNTADLKGPQICTGGQVYRLSSTFDDLALIPAGEQIGIASAFHTGDGYMNYSCRPSISFTPESNTSYVGVLLFKDKACYLQILREDPSTPTGLAAEPSVRRGSC